MQNNAQNQTSISFDWTDKQVKQARAELCQAQSKFIMFGWPIAKLNASFVKVCR